MSLDSNNPPPLLLRLPEALAAELNSQLRSSSSDAASASAHADQVLIPSNYADGSEGASGAGKDKGSSSSSNAVRYLGLGGCCARPIEGKSEAEWYFYMPFLLGEAEVRDDGGGEYIEVKKDGKTGRRYGLKRYHARLWNIPTIVELQKTQDHSNYAKLGEVGQCLVVGDEAKEGAETLEQVRALRERGEISREAPHWSYMKSGIAPPAKNIVERRFKRSRTPGAEHPGKYDPSEVAGVEILLQKIIKEKIIGGGKSGKKVKKVSPSVLKEKEIVEVEEEVVKYEPYMDDYGRSQGGVAFEEDDPRAKDNPGIWLPPSK